MLEVSLEETPEETGSEDEGFEGPAEEVSDEESADEISEEEGSLAAVGRLPPSPPLAAQAASDITIKIIKNKYAGLLIFIPFL